MNSDITRALLEAAIEIEELKAERARDPRDKARFTEGAAELKKFLDRLYSPPNGVDLSEDWERIADRLRDIIGEPKKPSLAAGVVIPRDRG